MTRFNLLIGCLALVLLPHLSFAQDVQTYVVFDENKQPEHINFGKQESHWKVAQGVLANLDDQTIDSFRIMIKPKLRASIVCDTSIIKRNPKGNFWGIAFILSNGTRVQVFNQAKQLRYYIREKGKKLVSKRLAKLDASQNPRVTLTLKIDENKFYAQAGDGKTYEIPIDNPGIASIWYQSYTSQVNIHRLFVTTPVGEGGLMSSNDQALKSQLDTVESVLRPEGPKAYVALYIGDSITRHGANANTIAKLGWDHVAGMAATDESKDYAHLFAAYLQTQHPTLKVYPMFHGKGGSGSAANRVSAIGDFDQLKPQVVVIQLGEHERAKDGVDLLKAKYTQLITHIQGWANKPTILCVGTWSPRGGKEGVYSGWSQTVDQTMQGVCQELGVGYASMAKHALNPINSGWGTSKGVQWHPNDAGMQAYADELVKLYSDTSANH